MNTIEQAQEAMYILGSKPDFTNKRKGFRTFKWYASPKRYAKKLKKAGVVIHDSFEHGSNGSPSWVRSSITIKVPLSASLKAFTDPTPKPVPFKKRTTADMKNAGRRYINSLDRDDLIYFCKTMHI